MDHCHSEDNKAEFKDNNNAAELSNLFGFSTLTQNKKALLDVEMLKEGFCNKTIISEALNHLPHQVIEKA